MKLNSLEKILKSPTCWGFFFVILLASCNRKDGPPVSDTLNPSKFTYTPPIELIMALRNVNGYEDSHHIPGHEKLGHDHSTPESWTNGPAVEALATAAKKYLELNPKFLYILSRCLIPDYKFHTMSFEGKMAHYSNATKAYAPEELVAKALDENKGSNWAIVFTDRILLIDLDENYRMKVKEKRLSQ